jgi:hypothetical protein
LPQAELRGQLEESHGKVALLAQRCADVNAKLAMEESLMEALRREASYSAEAARCVVRRRKRAGRGLCECMLACLQPGLLPGTACRAGWLGVEAPRSRALARASLQAARAGTCRQVLQ